MIYTESGAKPLNKRIDKDGKVWLYVYWAADATAKQGKLVQMGQNGWTSKDLFDQAASQNGLYYVAFPEKAQSTNTWGWGQIGGSISSAVLTTTTATVGHVAEWKDASLVSAGASTWDRGSFGVFTATGSSGTTHDIMLCPEMVQGTT
jgi:hypothetical protein